MEYRIGPFELSIENTRLYCSDFVLPSVSYALHGAHAAPVTGYTIRFVPLNASGTIFNGVVADGAVPVQEAPGAFRYADSFQNIEFIADERAINISFADAGAVTHEDMLSVLNGVCGMLMAFHGGMALHSSAVSLNGDAVAFSGPSGRGKSTIVSLLCPPAEMLGEDYNLIFNDGRGYVIGPSLFDPRQHAVLTPPCFCPLKRIYFIKKSLETRWSALGPQEAVRLCAAQCFMLQGLHHISEMILDNIIAVCSSVPCFNLNFAPNAGVDLLLKSLGE